MAKPSEYTLIAAYGSYLRSAPWFIRGKMRKASRENAPIDAVFNAKDGWRTIKDINDDDTRAYLIQIRHQVGDMGLTKCEVCEAPCDEAEGLCHTCLTRQGETDDYLPTAGKQEGS